MSAALDSEADGPETVNPETQGAELLPADRQPVIIAARRTAVCRANGSLKDLRAHQLLAPVLKQLLTDGFLPRTPCQM